MIERSSAQVQKVPCRHIILSVDLVSKSGLSVGDRVSIWFDQAAELLAVRRDAEEGPHVVEDGYIIHCETELISLRVPSGGYAASALEGEAILYLRSRKPLPSEKENTARGSQ